MTIRVEETNTENQNHIIRNAAWALSSCIYSFAEFSYMLVAATRRKNNVKYGILNRIQRSEHFISVFCLRHKQLINMHNLKKKERENEEKSPTKWKRCNVNACASHKQEMFQLLELKRERERENKRKMKSTTLYAHKSSLSFHLPQ